MPNMTRMTYRSADTPISDLTFMCQTARNACSGIPTYWLFPICTDSDGKIQYLMHVFYAMITHIHSFRYSFIPPSFIHLHVDYLEIVSHEIHPNNGDINYGRLAQLVAISVAMLFLYLNLRISFALIKATPRRPC